MAILDCREMTSGDRPTLLLTGRDQTVWWLSQPTVMLAQFSLKIDALCAGNSYEFK